MKKLIKISAIMFLMMAIVPILAACGTTNVTCDCDCGKPNETEVVSVTSVEITGTTSASHNDSDMIVMAANGNLQLATRVLPANATDSRLSFTITNTNILGALVSGAGVVTAPTPGFIEVRVTSVSNPNVRDTRTILVTG